MSGRVLLWISGTCPISFQGWLDFCTVQYCTLQLAFFRLGWLAIPPSLSSSPQKAKYTQFLSPRSSPSSCKLHISSQISRSWVGRWYRAEHSNLKIHACRYVFNFVVHFSHLWLTIEITMNVRVYGVPTNFQVTLVSVLFCAWLTRAL